MHYLYGHHLVPRPRGTLATFGPYIAQELMIGIYGEPNETGGRGIELIYNGTQDIMCVYNGISAEDGVSLTRSKLVCVRATMASTSGPVAGRQVQFRGAVAILACSVRTNPCDTRW